MPSKTIFRVTPTLASLLAVACFCFLFGAPPATAESYPEGASVIAGYGYGEDPLADPDCGVATGKESWIGTESSWWLQPWGNTCDGKAQNAIDGNYNATFSGNWQACDGNLSPRSFFSPSYMVNDVGQWLQIDFPEVYTIVGIELSQFYPGNLTASSTNKYTALLKDATIVFEDGTSLAVTFPETPFAAVSFQARQTQSVRIVAQSFYPNFKGNPSWMVAELDFDGAPGQLPSNGICDAQTPDVDADGIPNNEDNCPWVVNPYQLDLDHDGLGDPCDDDQDGDGVADSADNCLDAANPQQSDSDGDGIGDSCETECDAVLGPKSEWMALESSWWLQPWGNLCDGKARNAIDGNARIPSYDNWQNCNGDLSPRSFFAPRYTGTDVGQWIQIDFPQPLRIASVEMVQLQAGNLVSSLVNPNKYTAYVRDALLVFSDGTTEEVTFPAVPVARANVAPHITESLRIVALTFYPTTTENPAWFLVELDLRDVPSVDWCQEPAALPRDDDGDGVPNYIDEFPVDPLESADSDGDGVGNFADPDDDGDGVPDIVDTNPIEPDAWMDSDGDGTANQEDPDDDNDGVPDIIDEFPYNPAESTDSDEDGIGDGADNCVLAANPDQTDADGDGFGDACDNCPGLYNADQADADGDGLGDACDNRPPVASAGNDQVVTIFGSQVQLDGGGSYDEDGDPLTLSWTWLGKPSASAAEFSDPTAFSPTFFADAHGEYVIRLDVCDEPWGDCAFDTVVVSFANVAPVADAGAPQSVYVGATVTLDGSASNDANLDPLTYQWVLDSKPVGSDAAFDNPAAAKPSFMPDLPGTYMVVLVVSDGYAFSEPAALTVTVTSREDAVISLLTQAMEVGASLPPDAFKNGNMMKAFTRKLSEAIAMVEEGRFGEAMDKVFHDIGAKMDGCAEFGAADKNDWLTSCADQDMCHPLLLEAAELLGSLL